MYLRVWLRKEITQTNKRKGNPGPGQSQSRKQWNHKELMSLLFTSGSTNGVKYLCPSLWPTQVTFVENVKTNLLELRIDETWPIADIVSLKYASTGKLIPWWHGHMSHPTPCHHTQALVIRVPKWSFWNFP